MNAAPALERALAHAGHTHSLEDIQLGVALYGTSRLARARRNSA